MFKLQVCISNAKVLIFKFLSISFDLFKCLSLLFSLYFFFWEMKFLINNLKIWFSKNIFHTSNNGFLLIPNNLVHIKSRVHGSATILLFLQSFHYNWQWMVIHPSFCIICWKKKLLMPLRKKLYKLINYSMKTNKYL